MRISDNNTFVV